MHVSGKELVRKIKYETKKQAQNDDSVTAINFDLQKVLITPKGRTTKFYNSRKLATYNFSIFDMANTTAICNMWYETIANRGSNEIATCIYTYFQSVEPVNKLYMFSDACSGQQRNINFIAMCLYSVINLPIQRIEHLFFVKGHSQMEGDSVHACIEKATKHAEIFSPEEWMTAVRLSKKIISHTR